MCLMCSHLTPWSPVWAVSIKIFTKISIMRVRSVWGRGEAGIVTLSLRGWGLIMGMLNPVRQKASKLEQIPSDEFISCPANPDQSTLFKVNDLLQLTTRNDERFSENCKKNKINCTKCLQTCQVLDKYVALLELADLEKNLKIKRFCLQTFHHPQVLA